MKDWKDTKYPPMKTWQELEAEKRAPSDQGADAGMKLKVWAVVLAVGGFIACLGWVTLSLLAR